MLDLSTLTVFLHVINAVTPLGLAALLGVIILLLVHPRGPMRKMADNHLSHVQDSLDKLVKLGEQQLQTSNEIRADIAYVKGRLD